MRKKAKLGSTITKNNLLKKVSKVKEIPTTIPVNNEKLLRKETILVFKGPREAHNY